MQRRDQDTSADIIMPVNGQLVVVGSAIPGRVGTIVDRRSLPSTAMIAVSMTTDAYDHGENDIITRQPLITPRSRSLISDETTARLISIFSTIFCCCRGNRHSPAQTNNTNQMNNIEETKIDSDYERSTSSRI